jgi:hypothetical protein
MSKLEHKELLKSAREKSQFAYKSKHIIITSDLSAQTLNANTSWSNITQALNKNNYQQEYYIQQSYPSILMEK